MNCDWVEKVEMREMENGGEDVGGVWLCDCGSLMYEWRLWDGGNGIGWGI